MRLKAICFHCLTQTADSEKCSRMRVILLYNNGVCLFFFSLILAQLKVKQVLAAVWKPTKTAWRAAHRYSEPGFETCTHWTSSAALTFTWQHYGNRFKHNPAYSFARVGKLLFLLKAGERGRQQRGIRFCPGERFCSRGRSRTKRRWPWIASMVPESKGPVNGTCHFHSAPPVIWATRNDAQISG